MMDTAGSSFYNNFEAVEDAGEVEDDEPITQSGAKQKAIMSNYRWSRGLINPQTFGLKIESMEQLLADSNITKIYKLACKNGTRMALGEFERWTKTLKIATNEVTAGMINKRIKRCVRSVKVAVEREEYKKIEEDVKTYWKLTIAWGRDRFMFSEEEYLVRWFGGDLKLRTEWKICHGKMSKFSTEEVTKRFENFIRPLNILDRYGYRKKRIYVTFGVRDIKFILGPQLCESPEEATARAKSYMKEKIRQTEMLKMNTKIDRAQWGLDPPAQKSRPADGAGTANESVQEAPADVKTLTKQQRKRRRYKEKKKEQNLKEFADELSKQEKKQKSSLPSPSKCLDPMEVFQQKIDVSEGHPLLLSALCDFKKVTCNPAAHNTKVKDVSAESVEFKRPSGTGSSSVDAFVVGFEAKFDLNQIIESVCDFSDDYSYSSSVVERHIKSGSGLKKAMKTPQGQDCPYFLDLCDPETFAVFQSEFVDTAAKFYAQKSAQNRTGKGNT